MKTLIVITVVFYSGGYKVFDNELPDNVKPEQCEAYAAIAQGYTVNILKKKGYEVTAKSVCVERP